MNPLERKVRSSRPETISQLTELPGSRKEDVYVFVEEIATDGYPLW